jgi:hypothetical protein
MVKKKLNKFVLIQEFWYFISSLIFITIILEIFWPSLVLIYFNPLFLFVIWLILAIYLLFKN